MAFDVEPAVTAAELEVREQEMKEETSALVNEYGETIWTTEAIGTRVTVLNATTLISLEPNLQAFFKYPQFNRMQSAVFETVCFPSLTSKRVRTDLLQAYKTDRNLVVSGKRSFLSFKTLIHLVSPHWVR